jgi:hypothetical protein
MAYYEEEEVRRLITNMAMWTGDGESPGGCGGMWARVTSEQRLQWRSDFRIPAIGVDALPTKDALELIGPSLAAALCTYYLSSLTFEMQAREILHISKSTYHQRLEVGHPLFMNAFRESVERRRGKVVHAYAISAAGTLAKPSADFPPLGKRRARK